jgi:hypothetical protein
MQKQCDFSKIITPLNKEKTIKAMTKVASDQYENYTTIQEDGNARPVC